MEKYMDIRLSDHFMLSEFLNSNHLNNKIRNIANVQDFFNIAYCVEFILHPLRIFVGKPIRINSCFRSLAVNNAVKGVKNSAHLKALAVDIVFHNADYNENYHLLTSIINYPDAEFLQRITKIIVYVPGHIGSNIDIKWLHIEYDKQCVPGRVPKIFNCDISKKKKTYVEIPISSLKYSPF